MADGIISMLLDRLASTAYEFVDGEVTLVLKVKKDVEDFAGHLRAIQAVLEDAEQRQVKDASVRNWLDQLKDISFQMVDVLDEWNTEMLRQQVEKQEQEGENVDVLVLVPNKKKKVTLSVSPSCFCFRKVREVAFRHDIASKIKDLNGRLRAIDDQRKMYEFERIERGIQQLPERQKTSSFVVMSEVFGREKEKDILITKLLSDRRGFLIIPILGMGGMGKTTRAQLVYNDGKVKDYFEKRVWVCVSDPFDEVKIAKSISGDEDSRSNELDRVLQSMSRSIEGKRFLLVLDDVWSNDSEKWEPLRAPLIQSGAHGSKILVTTRKHEVVDMMRATNDMINLGELSEEYCLSIFNHMAFSDKEVDESKVFENISKKIVEKCKGLPLAAKALGSLMHNKRTMREWLNVLNSKIWDREEVEQKVFQPLLLSYNDLAPLVKCCLLYCAHFQKDYKFERDKLVNLWMAQDYLNLEGNEGKGDIGEAVFDNLVARSFFQDLQKGSLNGKIIGCKMHDIVHDFVQSLTKNECLVIDAEGVGDEIEVLSKRVRHLTLRLKHGEPLPPSNAYYNFKNLRTLRILSSYIPTTIDFNFILQLKCRRSLNLSDNGISEVPKEIGELIHLRHIDLSFNRGLSLLPDNVCELYNLYTLHLGHCSSLKKLPDNMGRLISLKHLYVDGCHALEYMPKGIRRLKKLKRIPECVVVCGEDENKAALQLGDLKVLNLEGRLVVRLKGNVKDESELEKAQLWHMNQLFHLGINCMDVLYKQQANSTVEILNALRPHENLESLDISHHSGATCPNWMMSLQNLRSIFLYVWDNCEFLPPLGKLPYLEELILQDMQKVKKIGGEFLGIVDQEYATSLKSSSSSSFFPKLKRLWIWGMSALEEWEIGVEGWNKEDSEISIMPCLFSLNISFCESLTTLPDFLCKTLVQELIIENCPNLSERCEQGSGEEWPRISRIPNIKILS